MATLRDIRRRIRSVKNIQQITRAMKLVAAAKVRRCQERILAARPYSELTWEVIGHLATRCPAEAHPLLDPREGGSGRVLLLEITSDKGLCGAYNTNLNRRAMEFLRAYGRESGEAPQISVVGKKGRDFLRRRGYSLRQEHTEVYGRLGYDLAKTLGEDAMEAFLAREVDRVYILYNRFRSLLSQQVTLDQLLPLAPPEGRERPPAGAPPGIDYLYEPSPEGVLAALLPRHLLVQVYRSLLDAEASEFAARMAAMDNATRNAEEMIYRLTLTFNRVRQAAITKEIIEVVGGAEALRG